MESEWRQKGEHELTPEQLIVKRRMDAEWKERCDLRGRAFYLNSDGSRRTYTTKEMEVFQAKENRAWDDFMTRSIEAGLYEEITLEMQIADMQVRLEADTARLNTLTAAKVERDRLIAERDKDIVITKDPGIKDLDKDVISGGRGS